MIFKGQNTCSSTKETPRLPAIRGGVDEMKDECARKIVVARVVAVHTLSFSKFPRRSGFGCTVGWYQDIINAVTLTLALKKKKE